MNAPALAQPASLRELFLTFTLLARQGCGGVLATMIAILLPSTTLALAGALGRV
jgi:hypothetical protein